MARTAEDFIHDAKQQAERLQRTHVLEGISADDSSFDGGDEIAWRSIRETDASYDGPTTISGPAYGTVASSIAEYDGSDEAIAGTERSQDSRVFNEHSGSYAIDDDDSGYDIPVRNYQRNTNQFDSSVSGQPTRIIKKRTNMLEDMFHAVQEKIPKAGPKSKKKDDPLTKVAGVTRKLLTLQEITHNKPILVKLVLWTSDNLDHGLEAITKGHQPVEIWSNLEYDDAEILVDAFLEMGQKSEKWAMAVRQVMDYEKKVKLGIILIPRAVKSIVHLFSYGVDIRIQA